MVRPRIRGIPLVFPKPVTFWKEALGVAVEIITGGGLR